MRAETLKKVYKLEQHPEGGWFSEVYVCPFTANGRPLAGSIYFLLDRGEISHFHQIDCDELWYGHEGCGLRVTVIENGLVRRLLLGGDTEAGQRAMALLPAGSIFAAENLDPNGYSFLSCATAPAFRYEGFRLVRRAEIARLCPKEAEALAYLAYPEE
ncbi:MAG: cupin domain-containing protein [Clostridia bacterium]|nr:cupin domain-containing protein [Clostridia bacterium]